METAGGDAAIIGCTADSALPSAAEAAASDAAAVNAASEDVTFLRTPMKVAPELDSAAKAITAASAAVRTGTQVKMQDELRWMAAESVPLWCIREFEEQRRVPKEEEEKAADALLDQQRRIAVKQAAAAQYAQSRARLNAGIFQSPQHTPAYTLQHSVTGMTPTHPLATMSGQPVPSMYGTPSPMYAQPTHPQLPHFSHLLNTPAIELGGTSVHYQLMQSNGLNYASMTPVATQSVPGFRPFTPNVPSYAQSGAHAPSSGTDTYFGGLHTYTDFLLPSATPSHTLPRPHNCFEDASTRLLQQFEQARHAQECYALEQERVAMEREFEAEQLLQERMRERIEREAKRREAEEEKDLRRLEREANRLEREREKEQRALLKSEKKRQREEELELKRQIKLENERSMTERRWREFPDLMQRIEELQTDLQSRVEASLLLEYPTAHDAMSIEKVKRELDALRKQVTLKDRKHQTRGDGARARAKDKRLYCLCKTAYDDSQFYIGCDECDNWFHARCVGISEADAESLEVYTCPQCRAASNAAGAEVATQLFGSPSTSESGSDTASVGDADEADELNASRPRLRLLSEEESGSTRVFVRADFLQTVSLQNVLLEIHLRPRTLNEAHPAEAVAALTAKGATEKLHAEKASRRTSAAAVASEATSAELLRIWHTLKEIDMVAKYQMFASPVDPIVVRDYYKLITDPMDLSTMQRKVRSRRYATVDEMHTDFELMCHNALVYNPPGDEFYNEALRVRKERWL